MYILVVMNIYVLVRKICYYDIFAPNLNLVTVGRSLNPAKRTVWPLEDRRGIYYVTKHTVQLLPRHIV